MKFLATGMIALLVFVTPAIADTPAYSKAELASRLAIAQDFVRYLAASHRIALDLKVPMMAEKQMGERNTVAAMATALSRKADSLGMSTAVLKAANLSPPDAARVAHELSFYEQDRKFYDEAARLLRKMSAGANPSPADAAEFDRASRMITQLDHTILDLGPFVIALISDGHYPAPPDARRLLITKTQRQTLVDRIDAAFKQDGDNTDNTGNVGAAFLLKYGLTHNALASDE